STILDGKLFILTWLEGKVFVCNPDTFEEEAQFDIRRQGWGLTTDGTQLIMSDGSAQLFFINPARFDIVRSITVRRDGKSVRWLNELEYIDGRIWANVYLTDEIVIINPESGEVEGVVDCTGLLPEELRSPDTDVLNGIAYNPEDGAIYITGKYWPRMYRIGPLKK
ncbi:MAG: glutaminyl-peptide cyclotransferase, partial [Bacteroidales bacterium]|nr:glutaminyl-peptide cyclotransferase [Bacteroidales bacterium]